MNSTKTPRQEARLMYTMDVPVDITQRQHLVPIPRGYFVKCIYDHIDLAIYSKLEDDVRDRNDISEENMASTKGIGLGTICDYYFHIPSLEFCRASFICPDSGHKRHELRGVTRDQYYLVIFKKGMYWVRYDWLEVVTDPPV